MPINALPTPPSRTDPINFAQRGDALLSALPGFVTEANALQVDVNLKQQAASDAAAAAVISADAALASKNAAGLSSAAALANKNAAAAAEANAIANANTAGGANAAAQTALAGTASAAAQAANYRDQAIAASQVASAANEALAAMSQTLHSGNIVKMFPYDTSKDSDGGAWVKKCQDKSWFKEALGGDKWINQKATLALAWATTGAAVNTVYQNTTDGKFYSLGGTSAAPTQTEVFRGIGREFPATSMLVAEAARVIVYDTSVVGCPMWMVFVGSASSYQLRTLLASCVVAVNGSVIVGGAGEGIFIFNFISDSAVWVYGSGTPNTGYMPLPLSGRNTVQVRKAPQPYNLIDYRTNDIAVTVLDNAPVDPATGLKVPTIAVATAGGVSVIKDDGTVVNNTAMAGPSAVFRVHFDNFGNIYAVGQADGRRMIVSSLISNYSTTIVNQGDDVITQYNLMPRGVFRYGVGLLLPQVSGNGVITSGGSGGIQKSLINISKPQFTMQAAITKDYSTGWQVGDSRLATLADTVAETITASGELVGNGTFDTDTAGWTASNSTLSVVNGAMRVTAIASLAAAWIPITCVVGKSYRAVLQFSTYSMNGAMCFNVGTNVTPINAANGQIQTVALGTQVINFVASQTTQYISATGTANNVAGDYFDIDNISVKLATPDRSVKNNGLILNGTLQKAPVAVGANLIAYSGFSAANYFQQPYSANQDYALAQFALLLSLKEGANSVAEVLLERAYYTAGAYSGPRIRCEVDAAGKLKATFSDGTNSVILTSAAAVNTAAWQVGLVIGYDGVNFRMMQNGVDLAAPVARGAVGSLSNSNAVLNIGLDVSGVNPAVNVALTMVRAGATWPSNDQGQHIFRTESALFQPGALGTIDGTSSAVGAMAFDDSTELLQVATSWGRSAFKDLVRVESEVSSIGAITSIAASNGIVSIASATSARIYQPSLRMRDELRRQTEAARALGKVPAFFEFDTIAFSATTANASNSLTAVAVTAGTPYVGMGITGTGIPAGTTITGISGANYTLSANATAAGTAVVMGQAGFNLPKGYKALAVYAAEARKREGATKTWTRSFDGFLETVNFGVSPGANVWVSIMAIRSN